MLPRYFDYIFVHSRQKARLRPKIFVNFRPEPDPKSPARLTTMARSSADGLGSVPADCSVTKQNECLGKFNCLERKSLN